MSDLAWGILGTGRIAKTFANAVAESKTGRLVAVASRQRATADQFAGDVAPGIAAYGSYEELIQDSAVEAVYISTPHPFHAEWAIRAARAGKHILCEKPVGLNYAEAMAVAQAVRENGVFFMEAFMYRAHPQTARIIEIIRSGVLGEIHLMTASFGFGSTYQAESRLYRQDLGGGGILDVGCYPMSMARLVAGVSVGRPFAEPVELTAMGKLHDIAKVDEKAVAILSFENGLLAQISTSIDAALENRVSIHGSKGSLKVPSPWLPGPVCKLELTVAGKTEEIEVVAGASLYTFEIDAVAAYAQTGEAPFMPIEDTLGNMAALDRWRKAIGMIYESETETAIRPALPPLRSEVARVIPGLHRALPGLDKPVSRMVMGTVGGWTIERPHGFALYDLFMEYGGNCFDTAYVYGGGRDERLFGQWMRQRGVREQTVVIAKGAHTPNCYPDQMVQQFNESLERMQTDYADIYMLHRDNPEVPVGEFVEALNELKQAGRVRLFGGSNWGLDRIAAANAYAREKGLAGFSVLSNQFSLARMCDPVWAGCVSCSDLESRQWLEREQMPLFAWSSQARGFFVRGSEAFTADAELVRCWYSKDNFERLCRARELARSKGTSPIHIAAAYVLQQKFPLFALIGPQKLSEIASCFASFDVVLSSEEIAWLNLEE